MKRNCYPDCLGRADCPVRRRGRAACDCRRCQSSAPFGFPPADCLDLIRELFNRR